MPSRITWRVCDEAVRMEPRKSEFCWATRLSHSSTRRMLSMDARWRSRATMQPFATPSASSSAPSQPLPTPAEKAEGASQPVPPAQSRSSPPARPA